jgi:hypothetical protein
MFGSLQVLPPSFDTLTATPEAGETRLKAMFA